MKRIFIAACFALAVPAYGQAADTAPAPVKPGVAVPAPAKAANTAAASFDPPATDQPAAAPIAKSQKAFEVAYSDAEETIDKGLAEKGAGDKIAALINGHTNGALTSFDKPVTIEVRGLTFDKQSRHWSANLLFNADGEVLTAMPVAGHYEEMLEVPVLKREVRSGDVISETDIEVRDFPTTRTRTDTVSDISSLIGKSPVRSISPFRPIRENEIASPALIKKNALVEIHYRSPGMEITTSGQAMTEGAKGDVIDVRNVASKKIIRAIIEDYNTVSVLMPGSSLSDNRAVAPAISQLAEADHATN